MSTTLYIDGQWVPAQQGGTRTITCPADGTEVAVVAEATREDTERAIAAARVAFDDGRWSGVPAPERGAFLLRVHRPGLTPCRQQPQALHAQTGVGALAGVPVQAEPAAVELGDPEVHELHELPVQPGLLGGGARGRGQRPDRVPRLGHGLVEEEREGVLAGCGGVSGGHGPSMSRRTGRWARDRVPGPDELPAQIRPRSAQNRPDEPAPENEPPEDP